MNSTALILRVYKILLKLYPMQFRSEYEEEMVTVFALHLQDRSGDGRASYSIACLQNIFDLLCNLFPEYLAEYGKEFPMEKMLSAKFQHHLIWWGCLTFGVISIFRSLFINLTGTSTVKYIEYTFSTFAISALTGLVFTGIAAGLFWMGIPRRKGKWSFFFPVLASVVLTVVLTWMSKTIVYAPMVSNWFTLYGWPFLQTVLWGVVFGGCFGWVYQGRQGAIRFSLLGGTGKALAYIVWQSSIILTYGLFHLNAEWPSLIQMNTWFYIWNLVLNMIGWMIFGALIGWEIDRANRVESLAVAPDLS
jgi:hypothetical protein